MKWGVAFLLVLGLLVAAVVYRSQSSGFTAASAAVSRCQVQDSPKRGAMSVRLVITGSRRQNVTADLRVPNAYTALPVQAQFNKKFLDSGDLYIDQWYGAQDWHAGQYTVVTQLDGKRTEFPLYLTADAEHAVFVICN